MGVCLVSRHTQNWLQARLGLDESRQERTLEVGGLGNPDNQLPYREKGWASGQQLHSIKQDIPETMRRSSHSSTSV